METPSHLREMGVVDSCDLSPGVVLGALVEALHLGFAGRFALRFPGIRPARTIRIGERKPPSIGRSVQIMGEDDVLEAMIGHAGIGGLVRKGYLVDYGSTTAGSEKPNVRIRPITDAGENRRVRRLERRAKAAGRPYEVGTGAFAVRDVEAYEKAHGRTEEPPYVNVSSLSTKRRFPLFLGVFDEGRDSAYEWKIDSYGLMTRA